MTQMLRNSKVFETFISKRLLTNKNTIHSYLSSFSTFFDFLKKDPEQYFNNGNDYEADISRFYLYCQKERKYTPLATKAHLNAIKQFICTIDRSARNLEIWDTIGLRLRGTEPASEETPFSKTDLKRILSYGDAKSRAMFLMMISSGMREESLIGLLPSDIHDDEKPTRIVLRPEIVKGKKNKVTTFISDEATDAYHSWMKIRAHYLETAVKRYAKIPVGNTGRFSTKNSNDNRVFPMSERVLREVWTHLVKKAGMAQRDAKTNRLKAHPHSLRKFFRSYLGNVDLAEDLMGHRGYLTNAYRQKSDSEKAKDYQKYVSNVTIFGASDDSTLRSEIEKLKAENKQLREDFEIIRYNELLKENVEFQKQWEEEQRLHEEGKL